MLKIIVRIGRKNNAPYIGVNFMIASSNRHHVYAANPSQIPIPNYCLRVYI